MSMNEIPAEALRRFWSRVEVAESGCWIWTGTRSVDGYGALSIGGTIWRAHRLAVEWFAGEIPAGCDVDHACRVRLCVNPAHLRPATRSENMQNQASEGRGRSGIRGVGWDPYTRRWQVKVQHHGRTYHGGRFDDLAAAERAARDLRNNLFTHNEADRGVLA